MKTVFAYRGRCIKALVNVQLILLSFAKNSTKTSRRTRTKATIFGESKIISFAHLCLKLNQDQRSLPAFAFQIQWQFVYHWLDYI